MLYKNGTICLPHAHYSSHYRNSGGSRKVFAPFTNKPQTITWNTSSNPTLQNYKGLDMLRLKR